MKIYSNLIQNEIRFSITILRSKSTCENLTISQPTQDYCFIFRILLRLLKIKSPKNKVKIMSLIILSNNFGYTSIYTAIWVCTQIFYILNYLCLFSNIHYAYPIYCPVIITYLLAWNYLVKLGRVAISMVFIYHNVIFFWIQLWYKG